MKNFFLTKIRLSYYFMIVFAIYAVAETYFLKRVTFTPQALMLFSVNSFLYGFYISPILNGQKSRIEELHKIVRAEANALFSLALVVAKLPIKFRKEMQEMLLVYLKAVVKQKKTAGGEIEYEKMIDFCLKYDGKHQAEIDKFLDKLIANQQNRTNFAMQMSNRVYSNEWMISLILFSITLGFVLLIDTGPDYIFKLLAAILCTGLTMLLIILAKMSTLTHKKAKQMWDPYKKLIDTKFYRID